MKNKSLKTLQRLILATMFIAFTCYWTRQDAIRKVEANMPLISPHLVNLNYIIPTINPNIVENIFIFVKNNK